MVRFLAVVGLVLASSIVGLGLVTAEVLASSCGGEGQSPCAYTKAKNEGKPKIACPKGAFLDPRNGGECWSCPDGYDRTAAAVTADNACHHPAYTSHKHAKKHHHGTGLLKTDCPKGQFYDVGKGYCYSCPKHYDRTGTSVTSSKACSRHISGKDAKAKYASKALCPKGSFFDMIDDGTCWSCPSGFDRSAASVKAANACAKPLTEQAIAALDGDTVYCEDGLIEFGGKCVKKGQCGKMGERPCLLTERIPSCDKGLAEDFKANKCDKPKTFAEVCTDIMTALQEKHTLPILEQLKKAKARLENQLEDKSGLKKNLDDKVKRASDTLQIKKFEPLTGEIEDLFESLQVKRDDIKKEFLDPKPFCNDSGDERLAKLQKLDLMPDFRPLETASLFDGLDELFVSTAHAATSQKLEKNDGPVVYYWSVNPTITIKYKGVPIANSFAFIFETNTGKSTKKDKLIAVGYTLGVAVQNMDDPAEASIGYTYYGSQKYDVHASDLQGADYVGMDLSIPLGNLLSRLKTPLFFSKPIDENYRKELNRVSVNLGLPGLANKIDSSPINNVGLSLKVIPWKPDDEKDIVVVTMRLIGYSFPIK